jgi:hypothetical protein
VIRQTRLTRLICLSGYIRWKGKEEGQGNKGKTEANKVLLAEGLVVPLGEFQAQIVWNFKPKQRKVRNPNID